MKEVGRNDPCPCGSGKKYKKCCALKAPLQRRTFSKGTLSDAHASLSKITSMVSQTLRTKFPESADKMEGEIKEQMGKLGEALEKISDKAKKVSQEESQKNDEDSSS